MPLLKFEQRAAIARAKNLAARCDLRRRIACRRPTRRTPKARFFENVTALVAKSLISG